MSPDVRLIAFYLPQFHPIPENDKWWGPGFTEWTNVTRGRPLYKGHYQPRRPAELGYYDLRVKEVRHRQAELARKHGIHGFCYHYYWFSGRRLLERPLDLMLADRELDFPFCLCWANENWSRRWDGSEESILMEQKYAEGDAERFIRDVLPILQDPRYITVDGAPVLLVYRPAIVPNLPSVVQTWRQTAEEHAGLRLHLCAVQSFGYANGVQDGFDAMVEFPPHGVVIGEVPDRVRGLSPEFKGKIYSYADAIKYSLEAGSAIGQPIYRGIMTGWDNTARRRHTSHIFHGATPERYEVWLRHLIEYTRRNHTADRRLVFINAWNEWAEATYLEPDEKYQYGFLEATARAVFGVPDPAILIQALRQLTDGNEEAKGLLDQLDRGLRVNAQIAALIEARKWSAPVVVRDAFHGRFQPVAASRVKLPPTIVSDSVVGRLDALNTPNYERGLALHRAYDMFLSGWIASKQIQVEADSPIVFQLTNLDSSARYIALVPSRVRREDVATYLKARRRGFRPISDSCSLYSGYRAHLNLAAVEPGPHSLEAIVPSRDGTRGVVSTLRASIMIV